MSDPSPSDTATTQPGRFALGGDRLLRHRQAAFVALVLIPLATVPATIGFVILALSSLLHVRSLWRDWLRLLASPVVIALISVVAVTAISIAWSLDPERGFDEFGATRSLLLVMMLAPIARHHRVLAIAILLAVAIQNVAQIVFWTGLLPSRHYPPWTISGGFSRHPGPTALWCGLAIALWMQRLRAGAGEATFIDLPSRGFDRVLARLGWLGIPLAAFGLFLCGSRAPILGMLLVGAIALGLAMVRRTTSRLRVAIVALSILGVAGVVGGLAWNTTPVVRVREAVTNTTDALVHGEFHGSAGLRLVWWRVAIEESDVAPWFGRGVGSTPVIARSNERLLELDAARGPDAKARFVTDDLHSQPLTALVETGAVGLVLVLAMMALLAHLAWRHRDGLFAPWAIAIVLWLVYSIFNTSMTAGATLAYLAVATGFCLGASCLAPPRTDCFPIAIDRPNDD